MKTASFIDKDTKQLYRKGSNGNAELFARHRKVWVPLYHMYNWELNTLPWFKNI